MNRLESQLRSWQPRRPSAGIERRLYPAAGPGAVALTLRWLAPCAACLLLALTIASQEPTLSANSARRSAMVGLISNTLSYTNLLPGGDTAGRNAISPANFEWTNPNGFTSSISPFSPGSLN